MIGGDIWTRKGTRTGRRTRTRGPHARGRCRTEGEGGKPDTRPGDRLATIRRTLWWIGLALQLPFALTLIHFDTPYLILSVSYALFRQDWQATRHQSSAFPHLKRNGSREFLALVLGAVCWVTAGVMRLVADSPSNHGKETLPVRIFAGIITIIVLMAHRYYRTLPRHSGLLEVSHIWQRNSKSKAIIANVGRRHICPHIMHYASYRLGLINECSERPSTSHFSFLLIRKLVRTGSLFRMLSLIPIFVKPSASRPSAIVEYALTTLSAL